MTRMRALLVLIMSFLLATFNIIAATHSVRISTVNFIPTTVIDNPYRSFSAGCYSACGTACSRGISSDEECKAFSFVPDQITALPDNSGTGKKIMN